MGRLCETDGLTDDQTEILKAVRTFVEETARSRGVNISGRLPPVQTASLLAPLPPPAAAALRPHLHFRVQPRCIAHSTVAATSTSTM